MLVANHRSHCQTRGLDNHSVWRDTLGDLPGKNPRSMVLERVGRSHLLPYSRGQVFVSAGSRCCQFQPHTTHVRRVYDPYRFSLIGVAGRISGATLRPASHLKRRPSGGPPFRPPRRLHFPFLPQGFLTRAAGLGQRNSMGGHGFSRAVRRLNFVIPSEHDRAAGDGGRVEGPCVSHHRPGAPPFRPTKSLHFRFLQRPKGGNPYRPPARSAAEHNGSPATRPAMLGTGKKWPEVAAPVSIPQPRIAGVLCGIV